MRPARVAIGLLALCSFWPVLAAGDDVNLIVFGRVVWPGLDWFPAGSVTASRDAAFAQPAAAAPLTSTGRFVLALPPGRYFVRAVVDTDADGKLGPGDGIGFYGVASTADRPAAFDVRPDAPMTSLVVPIVFQLAEGRRLRRAAVGAAVATGLVRGEVEGADERSFIVLWPEGARYAGFALPVGPDGRVAGRIPAGKYSVAVVRLSADGRRIGGVEGVRDGAGGRAVTVFPGRGAELGRLKVAPVATGQRGGKSGSGLVPADLGLVRLEIAAGAPEADAWQVMLFASPDLTGLMLKAWVGRGVWLALRPATYYLLCGADVSGDGVLGRGDAMATTRVGGGEIGFVSVHPREVLKIAVDRVATVAAPEKSQQEKQQ